MQLRTKVLLIIGAVLIAYALLANGIMNWVIYPGFEDMEKHEVLRNLERSREALYREVYHLDSLCHDWGAWDDTHDFVVDGNTDYIKATLIPSTFEVNSLNLIYLLNSNSEVVWGKVLDLKTLEEIDTPEFNRRTWEPDHPLLKYEMDNKPLSEINVNGILMTEKGPMLVSSRVIITSENKGPVNGTIIMGKFLNEDLMQVLRDQTRVNFHIFSINDPEMDHENRMILDKMTEPDSYVIEERNDELIQIYSLINDIEESPILLHRVDVSRSITGKGHEVINIALYSIILSGCLILIVLVFILQKTVLGPLSKLTEHTIKIGQSSDLTERLYIQTNDEIGTLSREFNKMIEQLSEARSKLLEQSFYSGLGEMASNMLHNIRNALSPINESVSTLRSTVEPSNLDKIKQAVEELEKGCESSQREGSLRKYLKLSCSSHLEKLREAENELSIITRQLRNIEEILVEQDSISHLKKVPAPLDPEKIINNAISRFKSEYSYKIGIKLLTDLKELPYIFAERIPFIQILDKVLANSANAILKTENAAGSIEISAGTEPGKEKDIIHIRITDNGIGYEPGKIDSLFNRDAGQGESESSETGLHWCANIISAMKGRMFIESDGPGNGACTHILIPTTGKNTS